MKIGNISDKDIKYIKITYVDVRGEKYEIKTLLKKVDMTKILLCHDCHQRITPKIPQISLLKIITPEAMFICRSKITQVNYVSDKQIDIELDKPNTLEKRQLREYFRIEQTVAAILSCRSHHGMQGEMFLAKTVDISAGGVRITGIKSVKTGKQIEELNFKKYCEITIGLYLNPEMPINFEASFIRHFTDEHGVISDAFEFLNPNLKKVEYVKKYVDNFRQQNNI